MQTIPTPKASGMGNYLPPHEGPANGVPAKRRRNDPIAGASASAVSTLPPQTAPVRPAPAAVPPGRAAQVRMPGIAAMPAAPMIPPRAQLRVPAINPQAIEPMSMSSVSNNTSNPNSKSQQRIASPFFAPMGGLTSRGLEVWFNNKRRHKLEEELGTDDEEEMCEEARIRYASLGKDLRDRYEARAKEETDEVRSESSDF